MGKFKDAFDKIGDALADASSLDVVTFKGSTRAHLTGDAMPDSFEKVISAAKGTADMKITMLASTQLKLDGDVLAYFDADIDADETAAHAELVRIGQENREAAIDFIRSVVGNVDV